MFQVLNICVFDCLRGLSTIPDASHAAATTHHHHHHHQKPKPPFNESPLAADHDDDDDDDDVNGDDDVVVAAAAAAVGKVTNTLQQEDNVLCVNSDGGILNGSVGSLNKYLVPHQSTNNQSKVCYDFI